MEIQAVANVNRHNSHVYITCAQHCLVQPGPMALRKPIWDIYSPDSALSGVNKTVNTTKQGLFVSPGQQLLNGSQLVGLKS